MNGDLYVVKKINALIGRSSAADGAFSAMARWGHGAFLLYGLFLWCFPFSRQRMYRRLCVASLLAVLLSSLFSFGIGKVWQRKRPFLEEKEIQNVTHHRATPSFPSNHAMNSLAIVLGLFQNKAPGRWFMALWAVLLAFSRVYTGIHYVTDILGGWLIATLVHLLVYGWLWRPVVIPVTVCISYLWHEIGRGIHERGR